MLLPSRLRRIIDSVVLIVALVGFLLLDEKDAGRFLAFLGLVALAKDWSKEINGDEK